jgi:trimeric autotransporter adhesin
MRLCTLLLLASLAHAQYYIVSTVAGNGRPTIQTGDAARTANLVSPAHVATNAAGEIFFSDSYYHQVFRIDANANLTVIAGTGRPGDTGDGGPATAALLNNPAGLAFDSANNLYIADSGNNRIRRVNPAGVISNFAALAAPAHLTFDQSGNLFASQPTEHSVRRIAADGVVTLFAGSGLSGFLGDNGPAVSARLNAPTGIRLDAQRNLVIADSGNHRLRRVATDGIITTIAGNGTPAFTGDGGAATSASLNNPTGIAINGANLIFVADTNNARLRAVTPDGGIGTVAGGGNFFVDAPLAQAALPGLSSIAFDASGALILAVPISRQIRRANNNGVFTVAGTLPPTGPNTILPNILFDPAAVAVDSSNNLYIADRADHRVRRINSAAVPTTYAGTGFPGNLGNNIAAAGAQLGLPQALSFDRLGNLYIASGSGSTLRGVAPNTAIVTIAGGVEGFSGDGGPAGPSQFRQPAGLSTDQAGNLYIADTANHRVRRIDAATQIVTTIAGTGTQGFTGDSGPALNAQLNAPRGLAFDRGGNLYIADSGNNRVRIVNPFGIISTLTSEITAPQQLALDTTANLFVSSPHRIHRIDANTRAVLPIAGTGQPGFSGENVLGTNAQFNSPAGLVVDLSGNVFVADRENQRVRRLTPARIVNEGVANGATLRAGPVAPGLIVSIFGFDLGPTPAEGLTVGANGRVTTELGGTRVLFDGIPAPLLYVSANQVNAVVPYAVSGATTRLQVFFRGVATNTLTLPVATAAPGLFAITNQDATVNAAANPAAAGSVLILYGTGEGAVTPAIFDGSVANEVFPQPTQPLTVEIGGRQATLLYAGAAPGFVAGVFQVNVQIPEGLGGQQSLVVRSGAIASHASTIHVR